jgi:hypothetical protein
VSDEPGIGELARTIDAFRRDTRDDLQQINTRLDQFVLREVYASDKAAQDEWRKRAEREAEGQKSAVRMAIYGALGSVVASVVVGVVLALITKGGH